MNIKTVQYIRELDAQFIIVDKIQNEELKSMLTKYLCVRTSGLIETFIKSKISEYAQGKVPKEINRFMSAKFKDITNLKCGKLQDFLDSFSHDWAEEFNNFIKDHEQEKNSVESIIANRHIIAHGQNAGLSFNSMQQYYADIKSVINKLDSIIR